MPATFGGSHTHNRLSHPSFGGGTDVRSGERNLGLGGQSSGKGTGAGQVRGESSGDSADVFDEDCMSSSSCHSGTDEDIDASNADELMLSQRSGDDNSNSNRFGSIE